MRGGVWVVKHKIPGIFAMSLTSYQIVSGRSLSKFAASLYYISEVCSSLVPNRSDSLCAYLLDARDPVSVCIPKKTTYLWSLKKLGYSIYSPFTGARSPLITSIIGCPVCLDLSAAGDPPSPSRRDFHQGLSRTVCLGGNNTSIAVSSWS